MTLAETYEAAMKACKIEGAGAGDQAALADLRYLAENPTHCGTRHLKLYIYADSAERCTENVSYGFWSLLNEQERTDLAIAYADAYGDAWMETYYGE